VQLATIKADGESAAAVLDGKAAAVILDDSGRSAFPDIGSLLRAGDRGWTQAEEALSNGRFEPLGSVQLLRPILEPGAIVCVGLNYRTHITEMGRDYPEHPTYFAKLARALTDPDSTIELPAESNSVDYEGELVAVVGRRGRHIPVELASSYVAGFTLMNDVSMRDFQQRTLQWFAGKSWQSSTPVGPTIVTADELVPWADRELVVTVNQQVRQRALLSDLLFDVATLVADLSVIVELEPGDLVATGTPGGVGVGMEPKQYLADGDVVDVTIEGIGTLRNEFSRQR
jgi:acylpyruvate hydrolase